tara:strand:+ start:237 stop:572 length:336 start_codon:yes stop_codon:yes gene_type:complete
VTDWYIIIITVITLYTSRLPLHIPKSSIVASLAFVLFVGVCLFEVVTLDVRTPTPSHFYSTDDVWQVTARALQRLFDTEKNSGGVVCTEVFALGIQVLLVLLALLALFVIF